MTTKAAPFVGHRRDSDVFHLMREDDIRWTVCGEWVGGGSWSLAFDATPTCRLCDPSTPEPDPTGHYEENNA
jgi:hypothetical protein